MILNPCRQNIISQNFLTIINWAFQQSNVDVLLGGSCALSEFYLGHRNPEDVDFFVTEKADLKTFKTGLAQSFKIRSEEVIRRSASYRYIVEAGELPVVVHCALSGKLKKAKERIKYSTECDSIRLHTPDFIGAWKLSRRRQELLQDCTKNILDLYFLSCSGVTVFDLLSVFNNFKIGFQNVMNWPYRSPYYDANFARSILLKNISISQIDRFVERFGTEVKTILKDKKSES